VAVEGVGDGVGPALLTGTGAAHLGERGMNHRLGFLVGEIDEAEAGGD
jgi:hypothetical protein